MAPMLPRERVEEVCPAPSYRSSTSTTSTTSRRLHTGNLQQVHSPTGSFDVEADAINASTAAEYDV